jgi:hypothetical protein
VCDASIHGLSIVNDFVPMSILASQNWEPATNNSNTVKISLLTLFGLLCLVVIFCVFDRRTSQWLGSSQTRNQSAPVQPSAILQALPVFRYTVDTSSGTRNPIRMNITTEG